MKKENDWLDRFLKRFDKSVWFYIFFLRVIIVHKVQFYPQRIRPQRRLDGILSVSKTFTIPCNYKLVSFFAKSLNTPFKELYVRQKN